MKLRRSCTMDAMKERLPLEATSTPEERRRKWQERSVIEAIREKGYEPDEIVVRQC
jgi:hypothetical protein